MPSINSNCHGTGYSYTPVADTEVGAEGFPQPADLRKRSSCRRGEPDTPTKSTGCGCSPIVRSTSVEGEPTRPANDSLGGLNKDSLGSNMPLTLKQEYEYGICTCLCEPEADLGFCLLSLFCPCVASAELQRRLVLPAELPAADQDWTGNFVPSSYEQAYNYSVGLWGVDCICSSLHITGWIPVTFLGLWHGCVITPLLRRQAGYEQAPCQDCLCAYCCLCCRLNQEEMELKTLAKTDTRFRIKGPQYSLVARFCCPRPSEV